MSESTASMWQRLFNPFGGGAVEQVASAPGFQDQAMAMIGKVMQTCDRVESIEERTLPSLLGAIMSLAERMERLEMKLDLLLEAGGIDVDRSIGRYLAQLPPPVRTNGAGSSTVTGGAVDGGGGATPRENIAHGHGTFGVGGGTHDAGVPVG